MSEVCSDGALDDLRQLRQQGSVRRASNTAKELMKADSHSLPLVLEMAGALLATHDYDLVRDLLEKNPNPAHPGWIAHSLELKWHLQFDPDLIDLEHEFMEQFSYLKRIKFRYLQKLISLKKFKVAGHFVGVVGLTGSPNLYFRLRYFLALALGWIDEVNRCVAVALGKDQRLLSVEEQISIAAQYMDHWPADSIQDFPPEIDHFLETFPIEGTRQITRLRLRRALHNGSWQTVKTILQNHPEFSESPMFLSASTWLAAALGDISRARRVFQSKRHLLVNKALRLCRVGELIKLDGKNLSTSSSIRLFTVVRNEVARIPWFLDFYRALGVNRFYFVDNGSTDGTRELLLSQSDVHVFYTDTKYSEGASGMVWVNTLVNKFGRKGWNLYADVDEALVFPNSERDGLDYLTRYMEKQGQEALPAFMLDMHARRGFAHSKSGLVERNFVEAYPFFCADFRVAAKFPAPHYEVRGGGREHFFQDRTIQTKTPMIKGGRGIHFLGSSHMISPAVISDVSAALLHFRMTDQFFEELKHDISHSHRAWHCDLRQVGYLTGEVNRSEEIGNPRIGFYENSDSLLRAGLISAPERYLDHAT